MIEVADIKVKVRKTKLLMWKCIGAVIVMVLICGIVGCDDKATNWTSENFSDGSSTKENL